MVQAELINCGCISKKPFVFTGPPQYFSLSCSTTSFLAGVNKKVFHALAYCFQVLNYSDSHRVWCLHFTCCLYCWHDRHMIDAYAAAPESAVGP